MGSDAVFSDDRAQKAYNRRIISWAWYDWANHAYITTTASTFFPPYFIAIAAPSFMAVAASADDGLAKAVARDTASNVFALTVSAALLVAAVLSPVAGAYADITGARKRLLIGITIVASLFSSLMFVLVTGMWQLGLAFYFVTQVAMNIALGLSSSLLPHIALPEDMNRVSSLGYSMGYAGGGLLLALNTGLYLFSDKIGIDNTLAVRLAFLSVGMWWISFTLPLLLNVPEPPATPMAKGIRRNAAFASFTRLANTIRNAARYREMFKMLIAFWFYMEGIGAIILLATSYGAALGLDTATLIITLLVTQFVAFPYALIYGRIPQTTDRWRAVFVSILIWSGATLPLIGLYANFHGGMSIPLTFALILTNQLLGLLFSLLLGRPLFSGLVQRLDTKRTVILGLIIYTLIPVWGFFLKSQAEFIMMGWLVGTVQGGTQALSRSIYASLTPRAKSGEFFGLYGLSEKFAGILGPFLYGIVGMLTHNPRASILSISGFFIVGIYILLQVNEKKGSEFAAAEETRMEALKATD